MVWFRVEDDIYDHPKMQGIPRTHRLAAAGLWMYAGAYCSRYLTDGFITDDMVRAIGGTTALIQHLCKAGLWIPVDDGYRFHDWHDFQPARTYVESRRRADRDRKARARERRWPNPDEPT